MSVQIKICGLSTPETTAACADAGATHIGFNFYPPSPRFVSTHQAEKLSQNTPAKLLKVGVFVNPDDEFLEESVAAGQLDAIQLHGKEDPLQLEAIRSRFGLPVWKVLSVETVEDVARANDFANADFLLFDTKTPNGAALPGGMGLGFDWSLLEGYDGAVPWGLAGGLNPDNVADAIRSTGATLVDTASGVESAPGIKDMDKIAAFCKAALNP
ncbi:N-(5'-phosphoribosyl)anthranilate isomerase [Erythrobacter longus]|uniref:N-(5'-phosphoribosyl)anthranilate isomerase n=1 Tax=Erythrobacter longus TaxID=1044 RepID=A0A074N1D6_ERYLO|nr:phosphoribosylanthranilate isomerase [Erythrobacter longus]KEO91712.1 N-(5'-phosphoribosyl)anthranilate isomerase [Erythrobacter longus]